MRSIGARLTLAYALSATFTLACLFVVGYQLLKGRLVHGLDLLNIAEFEQVRAHLGDDYKTLDSAVIDKRIRETTGYASVLFYIEIDSPQTPVVFYSTNLHGQSIPDIPGERVYNTLVPSIGELRVHEFVLPPFDISIGTPLAQVRTVMRSYVKVCVALLAGMLMASVAIGFGLSRILLQPIRLISETANRIRSDNLAERIPVSEVHDEISDLARLLNLMFDRLEASFNQIRRFTADASHELKTPLSLIRLHAEELLAKGSLNASLENAVLVQLEELSRLNQVIDELLFLSRADAEAVAIDSKLQNPKDFLEALLADATVLVEHHGCRLSMSHKGEKPVAFQEKWLRQVLLNLLANSLRVSPSNGLITLRSTITDSLWRVSVEDEGPGLRPEQRERIFERFVRFNVPQTDDSGSGLGLAICRSIVTLHQGRIFATDGSNGLGLAVTFELPLTTA